MSADQVPLQRNDYTRMNTNSSSSNTPFSNNVKKSMTSATNGHADGHDGNRSTATSSTLKEKLLSASSSSPPSVITTTTTTTTTTGVSPRPKKKNYWIEHSPIAPSSHPHSSAPLTPAQINAQLRLNLGLSFLLQPNHRGVRRVMACLDALLFAWWEHVVFGLWKRALPLVWRQALAWHLWRFFFLPLHKVILGKSTGIHKSASYEFHALTTLMYFGRFVPNTVARMRFALSQICVIARPIPRVQPVMTSSSSSTSPQPSSFDWNQYMDSIKTTTLNNHTPNTASCHVELVMYDMRENILQQLSQDGNVHDKDYLQDLLANNPTMVQGAYVHVHEDNDDHTSSKSTRPVILWFYGGAFLAGDVEGNLEHAKYVGMAIGCDVLLPHYRLVPQVHLDDQIWDTTLSYRYLTQVRNVSPSRIFLWGISSGAGLAMRLLQNASWMLAASAAMVGGANQKEDSESSRQHVIPARVQPLLTPIPTAVASSTSATTSVAALGVILLCPFVDYTEAPEGGSFLEYAQHDLIVNQSVLEVGLPYLEQVLGEHEARHRASPVYGTFPPITAHVTFPPVCMVVGEHETVYDQAMQLVERLQEHHIDVTVGVWKYMFHVFCMIYAYLPEGEEAMQFCLQWMVQQRQKLQPEQHQQQQ